jgi:nitrite reductase/ring-hydroxylating ferredoxin subunit
MGRGVFRFVSRGGAGGVLTPQTAGVGVAPALPQTVLPDEVLQRQTPHMTDRDEVIFLLHTAAEIEHSLLAEYLYAAYSLDNTVGSKQEEWRQTLLTVAREEMAHLLSVQNLLRALGGPLNFEREDYPFNVFYPFPFELEPFSLKSVARYVLAEMPHPSTIPPALGFDIEQVKLDAEVTEPGKIVNRVGALFTLLTELVDKLIDQPADPSQRPDFRPEAVEFQARPDEDWTFGNMILALVNNKAEAMSLVERIGLQGEGPGDTGPDGASHFRRFFTIYQEIKAALGTNPAVAVARAVPVNPTTHEPAKGESDPNFIAAPLARAWADLFNTRYRILLADLAHILTLSAEDEDERESRRQILIWIFNEMNPNLATIAETLATSPRHDPPRYKDPEQKVLIAAGAPFTLPYTLQLPDQPVDRWRQHELLLAEAAVRIAAVRRELDGGSNIVLDLMSATDEESLAFTRERIRVLSEKRDDDTGGDDEGGGDDADFVSVGSVQQFPVNTVHKITVEGDERVLYHADPTATGVNPERPFYVSQLHCWHRHPETHPIHCELSGTGVLSGREVACATAYKPGCAHGSRYDITSGQVLQGPANRDLVMYATKRAGDELFVSRAPISPDNA